MNSNNDKDKLQAKIDKRSEETKTLMKIAAALQRQIEATSSTLSSLTTGKDDDGYGMERKTLREVASLGVPQGIAATIATFAFLRLGPYVTARAIIAARNRSAAAASRTGASTVKSSSSSYQLDRPSEAGSSNPFSSSNSSASSRSSFGSIFFYLFRLGMDGCVSLLVGTYTSMYFTDDKMLLGSLATVPLVPGRSILSEKFCGVVMQEIATKPPEYWRDIDSFYLRQFKVFSDNCRKRQAYEKRLCQEQDLQPPIMIPEPGVPSDYIMLDADMDSNGGTNEGDDYWAESFVTDQEDQTTFGGDSD